MKMYKKFLGLLATFCLALTLFSCDILNSALSSTSITFPTFSTTTSDITTKPSTTTTTTQGTTTSTSTQGTTTTTTTKPTTTTTQGTTTTTTTKPTTTTTTTTQGSTTTATTTKPTTTSTTTVTTTKPTTTTTTTTTKPSTTTTTTTSNQVKGEIIDNITYDELQIHFLELGNNYTGDSTYIKAGDTDILIDAGSRKNSAATIKSYVDQYCTDGILEYVIVTHGDQDHIAGFVGNSSGSTRTGIFYQYQVETIIDFALTTKTTALYEEYLVAREMQENKGAKHYTADECYNNTNGASRQFVLDEENNITLNILWNKYYFDDSSSDENNYSVCCLISYNDEFNFMFTGDLEKEGEQALADYYDGSTPEKTLPHCELYKGGHHGSKTSSNDCLLSKITPSIVCVCCCAGGREYTKNYLNTFPTQDMITRVAKYTDRLYVTSVIDEKTNSRVSMNGNITISCDGVNIGVNASNNTTKLKDTEWFNTTVYINSKNEYCDSSKYFTASTSGVTPVVRRVWPE